MLLFETQSPFILFSTIMADGTPLTPAPRPSISVLMKCCHVYLRIYANSKGDAFVGWCPRCAARVEVPIVAEGGSDRRMFIAS